MGLVIFNNYLIYYIKHLLNIAMLVAYEKLNKGEKKLRLPMTK